ncbi:acetyl-CoA carboxylase carboxyl transferase subunit alpha [bacterium Unc6]|nr:acetyl-CoA carboxylase carboxyl transferase subunit alpha [bacterium Unc6]
MITVLDFERPIIDLEKKIQDLINYSKSHSIDMSIQIQTLNSRLESLKLEVYKNLTPWQIVQIARHPQRPYTLDYIVSIFTDFCQLHGDRRFSDDRALIGGYARFEDQPTVVIGHQKGRDTKENLIRNFGMPHPEGYRKALRIMKIAEKSHLPVICFVDTPGAYPGIGAEERGQAEAIAVNLKEMARLKSPILVIVIGEGGSGGALGIGVGDRICILENAYYSVISPEGCAAILWKDRTKVKEASDELHFTGKDLLNFGIIDDVISEPAGGAHRNIQETVANVKNAIKKHLGEITKIPVQVLIEERYKKFRKIGEFVE